MLDHFVYNTNYDRPSDETASNEQTVNYDSNSNIGNTEHTTKHFTHRTTQRTTPNTPYPTETQYNAPTETTRITHRTTKSTTTRHTTARSTSIFDWSSTTDRVQPTREQQQPNCHPSITTVNKTPIHCKDALLFEENFSNNLQPSRWSLDTRMPLEFEVNIRIHYMYR